MSTETTTPAATDWRSTDATTMAPDVAAARLEALMRDADHHKALHDDREPDHARAVQVRSSLYEAMEREEAARLLDDGGRERRETDAEVGARLRKESEGALEFKYGERWEQSVGEARDFARYALGEAFEKILPAIGNDSDAISELVEMADQDRRSGGLIKEHLREMLASGTWGPRAEIEAMKLRSHPGLLDSRHPEFRSIQARKTALAILTHPPKSLVRALQEAERHGSS